MGLTPAQAFSGFIFTTLFDLYLSLKSFLPNTSALLIGETVNQINSKSNQIKCWFLRRGENRSTRRKTSRSRVENQQTQPTYDAESGNRTRDTLVEGERSHHCANPAPPTVQGVFITAIISSYYRRIGAKRKGTMDCFNANE